MAIIIKEGETYVGDKLAPSGPNVIHTMEPMLIINAITGESVKVAFTAEPFNPYPTISKFLGEPDVIPFWTNVPKITPLEQCATKEELEAAEKWLTGLSEADYHGFVASENYLCKVYHVETTLVNNIVGKYYNTHD